MKKIWENLSKIAEGSTCSITMPLSSCTWCFIVTECTATVLARSIGSFLAAFTKAVLMLLLCLRNLGLKGPIVLSTYTSEHGHFKMYTQYCNSYSYVYGKTCRFADV